MGIPNCIVELADMIKRFVLVDEEEQSMVSQSFLLKLIKLTFLVPCIIFFLFILTCYLHCTNMILLIYIS